MPGDEAIEHIRQTERCTRADAIYQLQTAIAHGAVRVRIPSAATRQIRSEVLPKELLFYESTGPGPSPMVAPNLPLSWSVAEIRADGTVGWFGSRTRCRFWVHRDDVLRIWPVALAARRNKTAPITQGVREAIDNLWPNGIPIALKGKHRDKQIAEWLKANGRSTPPPDALPRAVQRVLQSLKRPDKKRRNATRN
jgi:hypothetical protein